MRLVFIKIELLQVGFEFVSNTLDIVESLWCFVIPEQNITVPFLLVGHTREPNVILDRSHLSFKALLIGKSDVAVFIFVWCQESMLFLILWNFLRIGK